MKKTFSKFRIPTLLGLGVILVGIVAGVFLVLNEQTLISQAAPDASAQGVNVTNIVNNSVAISFTTSVNVPSFITYGINSSDEKTLLDDRDSKKPTYRKIHYFSLKNLQRETNYQYKITTGKKTSEILKFKTAKDETLQNGFSPIIGSVLSENKSLKDGFVFLTISGAAIQSALIKNGNFLIPISFMRKSDLLDTYVPTEKTTAKLTIISSEGEANILFSLKSSDATSLPPVKIGQSLDLTTSEIIPAPTPIASTNELKSFDLNGDGFINAADNATVLKNFGKNPQNKKADLNSDGVVDQKDLDLIAKQINQ